MWHCPQGVHDFLRAYYHHKSADWKANKPFPLARWTRRRAREDADLLHHGSGQGHGGDRRAGDAVRGRDRRLRVADRGRSLRVYSAEFARTGFQGGLKWYRVQHRRPVRRRARDVLRPHDRRAVLLHLRHERLGRLPGAGRFEQMQTSACTRMLGCHLLDGAGHWVQQEQPGGVVRLLIEFLARRG